jgi:hypothetical protein
MKSKITHEGEIKLGDFLIPCYVFEDGRRVLSGRGMQNALKMAEELADGRQPSGARLTRFLGQKNLEPFLYKDKEQVYYDPITCYKGNQKINGFEAHILVDICKAFLEARDEARNNNQLLSSRQEIIANQCQILVMAFARLGLVALIDEATGYQYDREKDALQKLINLYVSEELRPWAYTFGENYYKEIFRLRGWDFTVSGIKKRPSIVGKYTNTFIYEELKKRTPKNESGDYVVRFHQSLTSDTGYIALKLQLNSVTSLMEAADSWDDFIRLFNKARARRMGYQQLDLSLEVKPEDFPEE